VIQAHVAVGAVALWSSVGVLIPSDAARASRVDDDRRVPGMPVAPSRWPAPSVWH